MRLPPIDTLKQVKLTLEVIVLLLLVPLMIYTLSKDRAGAAKIGLAAR